MNRSTTPVWHTALAGLAALALASCATMNVTSYARRDFDPKAYRTFAWGNLPPQATGDARLDNNEIFDARVRAAVEKELGARGYEKANGAAADVEVHYHVNVSQDVEPGALHRSTADCQVMECEPRVYDEGTLFVDLVDTRTGTLLWRGWAQGPADGVVQNQALLETEIDRAVAQILQRLR